VVTVVPVADRRGRSAFFRVAAEVYRDNPCHRATEDDIVRMLAFGRSAYHGHADVTPCLMTADGRTVGRFAMIHDRKAPGYVQVAFFEVLPGVHGAADAIRDEARRRYPGVPRIVFGLWGHINYGAGFLASCFDQPPVFGLPYTPPYYLDHFSGMTPHGMVSYRFDNQPFYDFAHAFAAGFDPGPVRVRPLDRRNLRRDTAIYTDLNNRCFLDHPFWADRTVDEDYELFHPFRWLIRDENLLFAEVDGEPVGFLLWYPDFNELRPDGGALGVTDVLRYRFANPIRTVRLTEIGVLPGHRRGNPTAALILAMIQAVERGPYTFCEGGFIFESNRGSLGMTLKFLARAFGRELEVHRRFAIFEGDL